jgi:hypothetical protein
MKDSSLMDDILCTFTSTGSYSKNAIAQLLPQACAPEEVSPLDHYAVPVFLKVNFLKDIPFQ